MIKAILLLAMVGLFVAVPSIWAADSPALQNSVKMQEVIYGATIDSKIAFYQKRIYLVDCDCKILSDIGEDAVKKVSFLKGYRQQLIDHMVTKNVKLDRSSLHSFLGTKIHDIDANMVVYSAE